MEKYDKFKEAEYNIYKDFHRVVLDDDGIPDLKKTTFRMPGYRRILSDKEVTDYTIDNENIYKRVKQK